MTECDDQTAAVVERAREGFPDAVDGGRVVFGFDGYVDRVREVVADRRGPEEYDRLATLAAFDDRLGQSVESDSSLSFEWIQRDTQAGGHTSHLARAYGRWGFIPTMIGTYGDPVHDVFTKSFADVDLHSIGEPGTTDAMEFDDGKLMLTEVSDTKTLDWDELIGEVGRDTLINRVDGARLFGVGYWAETPALPGILRGLRTIWNDAADPPETVLVDPGDVRKLDPDDLGAGREKLAELDEVTSVVLSANRAETRLLASAYTDRSVDADIVGDAQAVFDAVDVTTVVCHGRNQSTVVTADGSTSVAVPAVDEPAMTTSAGDHFNAGLTLALLAGLDPAAATSVGNATAGAFVRTGTPPSLADIREFLADYRTKFA